MMSIFKKHKKTIEKNLIDFKDKHIGERCFIIGNGPSLRIEDLEKLKNETTFGVNRIYLSFDKTNWRPTYYAIQDSKMIEQYKSDVENLKLDYKFVPNYLQNMFDNKYGNVFFITIK